MTNQKISAQKAIRFFEAYTFFSSFFIFLPVLVSIYTVRNITTAEVLLIESIYNIVIALFEIPTGIFGDKFGHDKSVIIGLLGTSLIFLLFAFSNTFFMIVLVQISLGFFATCISGSDIGSLSTLLKSVEPEENRNIFSKIYAISTASMLMSYLLSGIVIKMDPSGCFIMMIEAVVNVISCFCYIAYYLMKTGIVSVLSDEKKEEEKEITEKRHSMKMGLDILVCGLLLGILSSGYLVSQIFVNELNIENRYLGIIYCLISVLSIIFAKMKGKLKNRTVILMPLLFLIPAFPYLFMIIPFIFIYSYLKAKVIPFVQEYISSRTEKYKARNLSISNMINNGINSIFMLGLSSTVYKIGFSNAMIVVTVLVSLLLIYIFHRHTLDEA